MAVLQPATVVALVTAVLGAAIDLRTRRIPNLLTFGSAAVALGYGGSHGGLHGLGLSAGGWAVGVGLFLPIFLLGGIGAGDVKLLAAVGAWLGPAGALWCALYTVLAGGVLAILVGLRHRYLGTALRNVWGMLAFWRVMGVGPAPGMTIADSRGPKLAYGVAIAAGTVAAVFQR